MSESRKKSGLFKNIVNRSATGKPSQPIEVCYVLVFSYSSTVEKKYLDSFFSGRLDDRYRCMWESGTAYSSFEAADKEAMAIMQHRFNLRNQEGPGGAGKPKLEQFVKESRLLSDDTTPLNKKDLYDGTYWIFTMKGRPDAINLILGSNKPPLEYVSADGFGERILSAQDNSGKHIYTRGDYLNEQENKPIKSNQKL
ncbi:MAG: hypothetical protein ABI370_03055 [Gammaproteobacteria bacterium]